MKVIPLYPNSKIPVGKSWQDNWNHDASREICKRFPKNNMGILLGDIVDVEGDTAKANDLLFNLVGDIPHPIYRSSKSTHHLFINPDPNLTIFCHDGMEFRAHRHQSVVPPSRHVDGSKYHWLKQTKFPIPEVPLALLEYYEKHNPPQQPHVKPGHMRPWCSVCKQRKYINRKRYLLEQKAFEKLHYGWQCHQCREMDVRQMCRVIRKAATKQAKSMSLDV